MGIACSASTKNCVLQLDFQSFRHILLPLQLLSLLKEAKLSSITTQQNLLAFLDI